jgi:ATP-binding cassette subfamily C protein
MKSLMDTVSRAFSLLAPRLRRRWLGLVPLALLIAGLEGLGTLLVFALLRLVVDPSAIGDLPVLGNFRAFFSDFSDTQLLAYFALLVALFYLFKNGLRFFETYIRQTNAGITSVAVSGQLLKRYLSAPYIYHLRHNSAELVRNTHSAVDSVCRDFMNSVVVATSEFLVVLGVTVALLVSAPFVTLAGSAVLAGFAVLLLRMMQGQFSRWGRVLHDLKGAILRSLQESFRGIKEIKVLGKEDYFAGLFLRPATASARIQALSESFRVLPRLIVETLFVFGIAGGTIFALGDNQDSEELLPLLGLFAYALMRLLPSVHLIVYHVNNCRFRGAAVDQVHRDWVALAPAPAGSDVVGKQRRAMKSEVTFEGVSYLYPQAERVALEDINLTIRRGEAIGVVGPTGAGKSTLIDLLMGLLRPSSGRVLADGEDIGNDLSGWRAQIGYVPQQIYLTDDTMRRNVALGLDDSEIDEERVKAVIRLAQLQDLVADLPDGLETLVGEWGSRLSGGERQRIAIARALYRNPEVLVFDEATSALDHRSATAVSHAIQALEGKKTMVIIAHSISSIKRCDRLVFMAGGRIADIGTHDELSARNADFRTTFGLTVEP